jgi:hypothetical protein
MISQRDELLILGVKETVMAFCPSMPHGHQRVVETKTDDPERIQFYAWITSRVCLRQYIGTLEVKEDRVYLLHLQGIYKFVGDSPFPQDWLTGFLRIPRREELYFLHEESGKDGDKRGPRKTLTAWSSKHGSLT